MITQLQRLFSHWRTHVTADNAKTTKVATNKTIKHKPRRWFRGINIKTKVSKVNTWGSAPRPNWRRRMLQWVLCCEKLLSNVQRFKLITHTKIEEIAVQLGAWSLRHITLTRALQVTLGCRGGGSCAWGVAVPTFLPWALHKTVAQQLLFLLNYSLFNCTRFPEK